MISFMRNPFQILKFSVDFEVKFPGLRYTQIQSLSSRVKAFGRQIPPIYKQLYENEIALYIMH